MKDVLFNQVNVISITRECIYVFLLEIAAALVWNKMSLTTILPVLFLLEFPLWVKRQELSILICVTVTCFVVK